MHAWRQDHHVTHVKNFAAAVKRIRVVNLIGYLALALLRFVSLRCLSSTHFLYLFGGKPAIRYRVGGDRLPELRPEVIETPVPLSPQLGGDMLGDESPVAV